MEPSRPGHRALQSALRYSEAQPPRSGSERPGSECRSPHRANRMDPHQRNMQRLSREQLNLEQLSHEQLSWTRQSGKWQSGKQP